MANVPLVNCQLNSDVRCYGRCCTDYDRAWGDCLCVVLEILENSDSLEMAIKKINYLIMLVEERNLRGLFAKIKSELGATKSLI